MKQLLKFFLKNKIFFLIWALGILMLIAAFIIVYVNLPSLGSPLAIHFDAQRGIDLLGDVNDIFYILAVALLINVLNFIITEAVFSRERILSYLILFITFFLNTVVLIAVGVIVSFNI